MFRKVFGPDGRFRCGVYSNVQPMAEEDRQFSFRRYNQRLSATLARRFRVGQILRGPHTDFLCRPYKLRHWCAVLVPGIRARAEAV